jgi:hypothetical protein
MFSRRSEGNKKAGVEAQSDQMVDGRDPGNSHNSAAPCHGSRSILFSQDSNNNISGYNPHPRLFWL